MKILLATPLYPPEIAEPAPYTKELATRLSIVHDVTVVAYANDIEPVPGVTCVQVDKRKPLPVRLAKFVVALWKAGKGKDVIYSEGAVASAFPSLVVSTARKIPLVVHMREDEAWERARHLGQTRKSRRAFFAETVRGRLGTVRALQRFVLRRASCIVVPSREFGECVQRAYGMDPRRLCVNEHPAETPEVLPFSLGQDPNLVLVLGSPFLQKNDAVVVRAVTEVSRTIPNVHLIVTGDGPEIQFLQAEADRLDASSRISFVGNVSRAESWALRKTAAVLVVRHEEDELPDAVVRGYVAGIPVIAIGGSGNNAALVTDVAGLPEAIAHVLSDTNLQTTLREQGMREIRERFSWDAHLRRLETVLHAL